MNQTNNNNGAVSSEECLDQDNGGGESDDESVVVFDPARIVRLVPSVGDQEEAGDGGYTITWNTRWASLPSVGNNEEAGDGGDTITWNTRLAALEETYKEIALLIYPGTPRLNLLVSRWAAYVTVMQGWLANTSPPFTLRELNSFEDRLVGLERIARMVMNEFRTNENWVEFFRRKIETLERMEEMGTSSSRN